MKRKIVSKTVLFLIMSCQISVFALIKNLDNPGEKSSQLRFQYSNLTQYRLQNTKQNIILKDSIMSAVSDSTKRLFYPVRERMLTKSLNGTWKFKIIKGSSVPNEYIDWEKPEYNDTKWDNISVPGNWETQGFKKPEYRHISEFLGLYRTSFKYDATWKDKNVILRFDGVHFGYECFINGNKVGSWGSAFNLCQFDITPYLKKDRNNILSIKVSTRSLGWEFDKNDCWAIAGITRDVEIFTLKNTYLEDIKYISDVNANKDATIKIKVDVNRFSLQNEKHHLNIALNDPLNNHLLNFSTKIEPNTKSYSFNANVTNPKLWTAETPNLYRLEVTIVNDKGLVIQRANENVGIRNVYVDGFNLKVNNVPVLLRGICLNEIDPKLGRALTYKERRIQLEQMKQANINFIRTAHYPFGIDFLNLCDEMGFYVADEVPFGHGDEHLKDTAYLPELLARAEATLRRDKNHPSIIIWTLGNENPYTKVVEEVIKYVKEKDPTRPRGLPQNAPTFSSLLKKQSKNVDIYMGHYLNDTRIQQLIEDADKPVIMTEYAHSLGLSFNDLEDKFKRILTEPKIIGGAIWNWHDQALLTDGAVTTQSKEQLGDVDGAYALPAASNVTQGVWIDSEHYLDTFGDQGTDGVVYADGYPQEDFFQVRKVYSPIVVLTDTLHANINSLAKFEIELENRFDFISINGYRMNWSLKNLNNTIEKGCIWLNAEAKTKQLTSISYNIPDEIKYNDLILNLEIIDPSGKSIYEKNLPIHLLNKPVNYYNNLASANKTTAFKTQVSKKQLTTRIGNIQYKVLNTGMLIITNIDGKKIAESPLLLRVGRKETLTLEYQGLKNKFYWNPYILYPEVEKFETSKGNDFAEAKITSKWKRIDKPEQYISGIVTIKTMKNGLMELSYNLNPSENATGSFLELGLTLKFNSSLTNFSWLGDGPFTTTPDKSAFNERSIWKLNANDIRFLGNRGNVDVGMIYGEGLNIGLWSNTNNIAVENIDGSVYVSQNLFALSYGNKFASPKNRKNANEYKNLQGTLVLFNNNQLLENLFKPHESIVPEQPYFKSYGW